MSYDKIDRRLNIYTYTYIQFLFNLYDFILVVYLIISRPNGLNSRESLQKFLVSVAVSGFAESNRCNPMPVENYGLLIVSETRN